MNKQIIIFIFLLTGACLSTPVYAQQARFDQANQLLEQQEYREAISTYREIADEGHRAGALWYNLGVAYSQLDSLGLAKYYFLKSTHYQETRQEAENAVQYVNERFSRRSAVLPELPWNRFLNYLSGEVGVSTLYTLAIILIYLGITGILLSWFLQQFRPVFLSPAIGAIFFSCMIFLTSFYLQYRDGRYQTAVLTDRQAEVYKLPDPNTPKVSTAFEGYLMRMDAKQSESQAGWYYVRLENGMSGWIQDQSVKVI